MQHRLRCSCSVCREVAERGGMSLQAVQELVRNRTADSVARYGWAMHCVSDDETSPTRFNAHTHGFQETLGHPDFQIVLPLEPEVCHRVFRRLFEWIRAGACFRPGERYPGIVRHSEVLMLPAEEGGRRLLRIVFPDESGHLLPGSLTGDFLLQFEGTTESGL